MLKIGQVWGMLGDSGNPWANEECVTRVVIADIKNGWLRYRFTSGSKLHSMKQSDFADIYDDLIKEAPDADQS